MSPVTGPRRQTRHPSLILRSTDAQIPFRVKQILHLHNVPSDLKDAICYPNVTYMALALDLAFGDSDFNVDSSDSGIFCLTAFEKGPRFDICTCLRLSWFFALLSAPWTQIVDPHNVP